MNEQNERQTVRLKGRFRLYMQWPVIMIIPLILVNIWCYNINRRAGIVMFVFVVIYVIIALSLYAYCRSRILKDLVDFAVQYGVVQNTLLKELATPYAIFMQDGRALWMNDQFLALLNVKSSKNIYITKYMPELNQSIFPKTEDDLVQMDVYFEDKEFAAELKRVSIEGFSETEKLMEMPREDEYLIAVSLTDVTELNAYIRANEEQRLVAGLIYIDNYDELMSNVEEERQSLLMALVERQINQYIVGVGGISKRIENDKYFIALQKEKFQELENDKFSLLESVKAINIGNEIPPTLSIGLGLSTESYNQCYTYARSAIDLALARGGDQAVIKDCHGITYYGGKREQTSKNTQVKARVKAEALQEFISVKDDIFVMGHQLTDVDSFGAAIGLYRVAQSMGKRVYIVINEVSMSLRPLYNIFSHNDEYPSDLFLTSKQALSKANEDSMVIVVDTNRPQMTECEELLSVTKTIIVLDHHRQSSDNIDNALLSYIEPYASSTCEMISEVLQYIIEDEKIPALEASSLYAGIVIDTNNFTNRTGVRTFEAAAFLRECGADITQVRKMLRDDLDSYQAKAAIISSAEVYRERFALAEGRDLNVDSPTIVGAQAANELLDIDSVKASIVFTEYNGRIYVSARSIDEINVQVIMERLGGGGHMNAAGAQFDHTDMDAAVRDVKQLIDQMIEEGDI